MFVLVRWKDAVHPEVGAWTLEKDLKNDSDLLVETCGYLVFKDRDRIRVAVSVSGDDEGGKQYTGIMTIPCGCVLSIHEMRPLKKPLSKKRSS